jgi:hypothetical protein
MKPQGRSMDNRHPHPTRSTLRYPWRWQRLARTSSSYIPTSRFVYLRVRLSLNDHDDDVHETLGDCSSNLEPNFPYNPTYLCIKGEKYLTSFCAATTSQFRVANSPTGRKRHPAVASSPPFRGTLPANIVVCHSPNRAAPEALGYRSSLSFWLVVILVLKILQDDILFVYVRLAYSHPSWLVKNRPRWTSSLAEQLRPTQ